MLRTPLIKGKEKQSLWLSEILQAESQTRAGYVETMEVHQNTWVEFQVAPQGSMGVSKSCLSLQKASFLCTSHICAGSEVRETGFISLSHCLKDFLEL